ncbi:sugar ABC transporter ATP-binding protein [Vulcanibacillus modesticaldus]|uniref:Sugar ABC transporter ATP-binding protein n=2 Tax=Vulcanibacillus modesticaldus TaxID=337097 RepID=A0A1D2YTZ5_9BACI|nr:sugar ABC transporter ATP-binding protein [Vulcanibacillus modesticaldus]
MAIKSKAKFKRKEKYKKLLIHLLLILGGVSMMFPFFWMVSTSLKENALIFQLPPKWIPDPIAWHNYPDAMETIPFIRYFWNTTVITVLKGIGEVFVSALVAYGFARFRFPGRKFLFLFLLSTIMIPGEITLIPVFIMWRNVNLIDTYVPLILPAFAGSAVFIFFLKQYFSTIPKELEESARIDGCNSFQIFYKIFLPISKPALITIGIWSFQGSWNDLMGPLIYLNSYEKFTLQLGLSMFQSLHKVEWGQLMAASLMTMIPVLIIFFVGQKYFTEGIKLTGIKG